MKCLNKYCSFLITGSLLLATAPGGCAAETPQSVAPPPGLAAPPTAAQPAQVGQQSPEKLDQLVAPIALYPDALIAQILAASANPTQIVEADRWLQQHSSLKGTALAQAVDKQPWDPSVKALIQFPSVLKNMDKNLAWTSALGAANAGQPQVVLDAIQVMRHRAEQAGNLKTTSQQTVTTEGQTIVIQPAAPETVYVPEYDPWIVYGAPVAVYPYWNPFPGLYLGGPGFAFGLGIGIGLFAGFGWGWHHWGADWHGGRVLYDHHAYVGHGAAFGHGFYHGGPGVAHAFNHGRPGFAHSGGFHGAGGFHPGAFHGFARTGATRSFAASGRPSVASGFHPAAHGGFHGGGHR